MHLFDRKRRGFWHALPASAVSGLLLLAAGAPVLAQSGSPLWQRKPAAAAAKKDKEVRRATAVQIDVTRLRSTDNNGFSLLMPDGRILNVFKSGERRTPKGLIWHGEIVNEPTSFVSFSVINDTVVGSILTGKGRSFRLRRDPSGEQVIEEIGLEQLPDEDESTPVPGRRRGKANDPAKDTCTTDAADTIDVMVVYTEDARKGAGGKDAIEADIDLAVDLSNRAYANSQIKQRLQLVHAAEVRYVETGNVTRDRNRLKRKNDGYLDEVHALRDRHGADVVVLIVENIGKCGKSYIMESVGNAFEDSAFAVVKRRCATLAGTYSFPHELGHVMSARHDWGHDRTANLPFAYNHGHVQLRPTMAGVAPWRTIMAYKTGCSAKGCARVLHFSNPDVSFRGDPTGTATGKKPKDNHRTLNETASTVANFRCSVDSRHSVGSRH